MWWLADTSKRLRATSDSCNELDMSSTILLIAVNMTSWAATVVLDKQLKRPHRSENS